MVAIPIMREGPAIALRITSPTARMKTMRGFITRLHLTQPSCSTFVHIMKRWRDRIVKPRPREHAIGLRSEDAERSRSLTLRRRIKPKIDALFALLGVAAVAVSLLMTNAMLSTSPPSRIAYSVSRAIRSEIGFAAHAEEAKMLYD
jgi:hypothetical protein